MLHVLVTHGQILKQNEACVVEVGVDWPFFTGSYFYGCYFSAVFNKISRSLIKKAGKYKTERYPQHIPPPNCARCTNTLHALP